MEGTMKTSSWKPALTACAVALGVIVVMGANKITCVPMEPEEPVCATPADCEELPHTMCVGQWQCVDGACVWECGEPDCIPEGETGPVIPDAPSCCPGLEQISVATWDPDAGICGMSMGVFLCSNCGNGLCESGWENPCNCEEDCPMEEPECIPEGESGAVYPDTPPCCEGLTSIGCQTPGGNGECISCVGAFYCTYCGDGECKEPENACNCPADCTNVEPCVEEGESAMPPYNCCPGLVPVSDCEPGEPCPISLKYCVDCGNGTCDAHENEWNCPQDCPNDQPSDCTSSDECPEGYFCEVYCGNGWCKGTCQPVDDNPCIKTGCSSQLCALEPMITTCEYLPEYGCLALSECGPFSPTGECAWKNTPEYLDCLANLDVDLD